MSGSSDHAVRLTKFPQSCVRLERDGRTLLIDPGTPTTPRHDLGEFGDVEAVLYTHRHPDHLDPDAATELARRGATLYGNADVVEVLDGAGTVVGDVGFRAAGFDVAPVAIPHVPLVDGGPGPPNTGFVLDGQLLHPGDGLQSGDVRVATLLVPVAGPSVSARDAYLFIERTAARTAVPIHYDVWLEDPELFARSCDHADVRVLQPGQWLDLAGPVDD